MIQIAKDCIERLGKALKDSDALIRNDLDILKAAIEQIDEEDTIANEVIDDLRRGHE